MWFTHQSVREELTEMEEHHDELSVIESLMAGDQNRPTALPGASIKGTPFTHATLPPYFPPQM